MTSPSGLQILWFGLIIVLWVGYFLLEGFDFGVAILSPFIAKDDVERRMVLGSIGPVWDGNEVWLLTAGGATFAAFPLWYATLFSGFYLALFLILVALIVRGVGFEFRHQREDARWRTMWDWLLFSRQPGAGAPLGRRLCGHPAGRADQCASHLHGNAAGSASTCTRCSAG